MQSTSQLLEILEAYRAGKKIQRRSRWGEWPAESCNLFHKDGPTMKTWDTWRYEYRVVEEPKQAFLLFYDLEDCIPNYYEDASKASRKLSALQADGYDEAHIKHIKVLN